MKRDLVRERTLRNVGDALRASLRENPQGIPERLLVEAMASCGVPQDIVDEIVNAYVNTGWIIRRDGRLYSGGV